MIDKVQRWIEQEGIIQSGDCVVAAVSGGADSVCLLRVLLALQDRIGFELSVIHVEHGIRGEESLADAEFVNELCRLNGLACHTYRVDVPAYAKEKGIGLEEAARVKRYECYEREGMALRRAIEKPVPVKIALAHHADDNAETILFRLIRGSGPRGLGGMQPQRKLADGICAVRPFLMVTRAEILAFLAEDGQAYRTDSSNGDLTYSRNRLRHVVMPELTAVNCQSVAHINQSGQLLREAWDYIEAQAEEAFERYCVEKDSGILIGQALFSENQVFLQKEVTHRAIAGIAGGRRDISLVHVEAVRSLAEKQVGRQVFLADGVTATRVYEGVFLKKEAEILNTADMQQAADTAGGAEAYEICLKKLALTEDGGRLAVRFPDGILYLRVHPAERLLSQLKAGDFLGKMQEIGKKSYTKWFDYDKIKSDLLFRKRRSGDYLTVDETGHKKRLKEYFINEKVPKQMRDGIWLLTEQSHVLWVTGRRIGAAYKVTEDTERILEVQIIGGNYHENQEH